MQSLNIAKHFCFDTIVNCLPFFGKQNLTEYDMVENQEGQRIDETHNLSNFHEKQDLEMNDITFLNKDNNLIEKQPNLIGNVTEEDIKKNNNFVKEEPDYFKSMNLEAAEKINFNNVMYSNTKTDKFKLEEQIEPGNNWLDENEIKL